ncbi:hypothetical protein SCLCIDRAFT_15738 [Scleroderma citrinum Foug A]|uniref:MINDY deubiquitinase domain-containing protein n=1 Tax=Scleroderma citrinum Foug A TaxID=1036808 RepID=A0A0C3ACS8_9AGAM|nr:hypothetical protein SCLCIDRAFT_15738 [Scleroderma citrinum Foug A]
MKPPTEQIEASSLRSSQADVWYLKEISFGDGEPKRRVKIITQNFNGPCSFIAICNILILRGNIEILPYERTSVSYEFLSQLVGEYLLSNCADADTDVSSALSIMPTTTKGLDLNPQFTAVDLFRPGSDGGELQLFAKAGIKLVHGWVVDPESQAASVLSRVSDYDSAVMLIADADHLSKGRLLHPDAFRDPCEPGPSGSGGASSSSQAEPSSSAASSSQPIAGPSNHFHYQPRSPIEPYAEEDRHKIESAVIAQEFLDSTKSQLTYYGLFQLAATVEPGTLVALFRNSHLSVLYKPVGENTSLYSLVTDHVFLHEASVVWERFEDIDGGWSTFVDSDFVKSSPAGGDFAGQTAEATLRAYEVEAGIVDPADRELAKHLQAEEDARAYQIYLEQQRRSRKQQQPAEAAGDSASRKHSRFKDKKDKCIIM